MTKKREAPKSRGQKKGINRKPMSPFAPKKVIIAAVEAAMKPEHAPVRVHRDYRIVLNDVWADALRNRGVPITHRDIFENLHHENPIAAMIRALGLFETVFFDRYGATLSTDVFLQNQWLMMWQGLRHILSQDLRGDMDGQTLWNCMAALALNAGIPSKEWE